MNGDPLLTEGSSVYPNQNFSSVPTIWTEDQEQAARNGIGCLNGPMLYLIHRVSARQIFQNGNFNPCAAPFPVGLIIQCLRTDQDTPPPQGPALGSAGLGILSVGHGGWFQRGNSARNFPGWGVRGAASSDTNQYAGVYGVAFGREPGVRGESGSSAGVVGRSSGNDPTEARRGPGVVGVGPPVTAPRDDPASWGELLGMPAPPNPATGFPGNPAGNGVVGSSPAGYAGLFFGNVRVTRDLFVSGNLFVSGPFKSAVVPHPDGSHRALQAVDSPESWFEDFGRAELVDGRARVDLDPDFAAVASTEEANYHVFLTPEGDSNGLYVAGQEALSFEVREQQQGRATLTFSYRVVARRKDVAAERLPQVAAPPAPEEPMLNEAALPPQAPPAEVPSSGGPRGSLGRCAGPSPPRGGLNNSDPDTR